MAVYAAWNALTGLTRVMIRLATTLMTPTGSLTVRSGVIPGGTPLLLTGSGMTGSVAPGRAVVQGTSAQGAYPAVVDTATSITVAAGHASLARIDTVWLVVQDTDYDSSGSRQAQIVYQQGTAGSGSAPTAPASGTAYLRLWDITVPAGASSGSPINWGTALTDQRVYTVPVGGITPGPAAGAYAGQWRDAGGVAGILERYSGSVWEAAVRLGNAGLLGLGDVTITRSATATAQVNGNLSVTGVGQVLHARKTSATQPVTSSTTLVPATDLALPVVAGATYEIDGWIIYDGQFNAGDLKIGWSVPAGSTGTWSINAPGTGGTLTYSPNTVAIAATTTAGTYGAGGLVNAAVRGYITAGATGTLQLQFAQNSSNPTPTSVYAGSWLRLHRVA
ncbi:hypothetical protein ACIRRH_15490 [Kitasatospora sp. NPDC101235]|uniref:hypothetical protein n=1 Tax=Kitasatospora sp. NPDC101235 TaxID=3364101 RepID=UPI003828D440